MPRQSGALPGQYPDTVAAVTSTSGPEAYAGLDDDAGRDQVVAAILAADPRGDRLGRVFRDTLDQLYDGQHTGRFRWDQLYKTEKTHFGTLIEINLRREFDDVISDGETLDFQIHGHEIDCKYSQTLSIWWPTDGYATMPVMAPWCYSRAVRSGLQVTCGA